MNIRHTLLAILFALGGFLLLLVPSRGGEAAQASEPGVRATPTPADLPDGYRAPEAPLEGSGGPLPDLVVRSIRVTPDPPLVNRAVTIEITIENQSSTSLGEFNNFFVDLYIDPESPPRACLPGDYFFSVQGFEVGTGQHTVSITVDPTTDERAAAFRDVGIVTLWAQVDNATDLGNSNCGNVVESREDNNLLANFVDVDTRYSWNQTTHEDFQRGFGSAIDLTNPLGILQNGTGWFVEPRYPQPEDEAWSPDPRSNFYNPDRHIWADYVPDDGPPENWNEPDQENVDIEIGLDGADSLFAAWEDARNGDLDNRDIYFSSSTDGGKSWSEPVRVNQDPPNSRNNQLDPVLVVDRYNETLYIFWEDNRLREPGNPDDFDIFFARSEDGGQTWVEPTYSDPAQPGVMIPSNPVNDKNVDPGARQINPDAVTFNEQICDENGENCEAGLTHLYVVWEDYRNGNADIFAEWSRDGGTTWLRMDDGIPSTIDANIHVQPDPVTQAGIFDQRNPAIAIDRQSSEGPINYCITRIVRIEDLGTEDTFLHYYPENPLPRLFIAWEDERNIMSGDGSNIYYTRGEFNYFLPSWLRPQNATTVPPAEGTQCAMDARQDNRDDLPQGPRPYIAPASDGEGPFLNFRSNLPLYRFEDDHVQVNQDTGNAIQLAPSLDFSSDSFLTVAQYSENYTTTIDLPVSYSFNCELRYRVDELIVSWQDNREGTFDIWGANLFDDMTTFGAVVVVVGPIRSSPAGYVYAFELDRATAACIEGLPDPPPSPVIARNRSRFSPQPDQFYDLSFPESEIRISDENTFIPKPVCLAPDEPPPFEVEPSDQTNPQSAVLPNEPGIFQGKEDIEHELVSTLFWNVWEDTRAHDTQNRDIFLRPIIRYDTERTLSDLLQVTGPVTPTMDTRVPIPAQVVQNNVKNQVMLQQQGLDDDFRPNAVLQSAPSLSVIDLDRNPDTPGDLIMYVGWHDNRNANPLIGFESNSDIFAARLNVGPGAFDFDEDEHDFPFDDEWRPTRSGSYVSSVFDANGSRAIWYDIDWWGDISADGILTVQTRFGFDRDIPKPPQANVVTYNEAGEVAWSQWTGIGGTGGFYTAPGQHITGPDGSTFPESYYIQYRVNFNPQEQEGIICLSEVALNYEAIEYNALLPVVVKEASGGTSTGLGAIAGLTINAVTGAPLPGAQVCVEDLAICTTSDSGGAYRLEEVPPGFRTVTASAENFISSHVSLEVVADETATTNIVLSPELGTGEMRVVLTWNADPRDLDSHLWLPPETPFHIYWAQQGSCDAFPFACLDVDDVTGFGPETTTIRVRQDGTYVFAIHRYAGAGTLASSGGRVQVYNESGLIADYPVPSGEGEWWHVFNLDGATGTLTPVNTLSNTSPAPYNLVSGRQEKSE